MKTIWIFTMLLSLFFLAAMTPEEKAKLENLVSEISENIKAHPKETSLYIELGFAYSKLGKVNKAQAAFEKARLLNPKKAIVHYMLGLIYEKKELKKQAIASWKKCLETATKKDIKETAIKHIKLLSE